jgi:hypothetical protein
MRKAILVVVLIAFSVFSVVVTVEHGYTGFLTLAGREPWALQMLLDLVIALSLFSSWMKRDARERGLPFVPYVAAIIALGSIGALAYLLHRELKGRVSR